VLGRLLLLLMLLPVLEIAVLVWLADETSWLFVLALLLGAGVLGAALSRQQSVRSWSRLQSELHAGQMPGDSLFDAVLVSLAAILLILPGLLSDVAAIALLFPPTRKLIKAAIASRFRSRVVTSSYYGSGSRDEIIDVQVIEGPAPKD
jgi:UPF0716 protein FxsA